MDKARRHLWITLAILAVGFAISIPVYLHGAAAQDLPFELTDDGKKYLYNIERMQGKEGLLIAQINDFWSSLWTGWELGVTIAVLTCIVALAYYLFVTRDIHPKG